MARHIPNLNRKIGKAKPRRVFYLFCEGKNTEPEYFDALRRTLPAAIVEVRTIGAAGVPFTIAERAAEKANQLRREFRKSGNSFASNDEVWAVFDRDDHPHFGEAVAACEAGGVSVARSNPCFEVWLILHYGEFDKPDDRHAVQRHFEGLCATYDSKRRKVPDCVALVEAVEKAEDRAERQQRNREKEGDKHAAPSTTVHLLTSRIRSAANASHRVK